MTSLLKSRRAWAVALVTVVFLWIPAAGLRGMLMAYIDHARGHREVKTLGHPPPWEGQYARLLNERYGVKLNRVAGCVVTPWLAWYVKGYNAASRGLLQGEYGPGLFEECARLAEQQFEAEELWEAEQRRQAEQWRQANRP
jgi:hypothetical protein